MLRGPKRHAEALLVPRLAEALALLRAALADLGADHVRELGRRGGAGEVEEVCALRWGKVRWKEEGDAEEFGSVCVLLRRGSSVAEYDACRAA